MIPIRTVVNEFRQSERVHLCLDRIIHWWRRPVQDERYLVSKRITFTSRSRPQSFSQTSRERLIPRNQISIPFGLINLSHGRCTNKLSFNSRPWGWIRTKREGSAVFFKPNGRSFFLGVFIFRSTISSQPLPRENYVRSAHKLFNGWPVQHSLCNLFKKPAVSRKRLCFHW